MEWKPEKTWIFAVGILEWEDGETWAPFPDAVEGRFDEKFRAAGVICDRKKGTSQVDVQFG